MFLNNILRIFNTLFHSHVLPQIFLNNNFQFLNTHTKRTLSIHKNILPLLNFPGKRKYYRELISYEQCKLARIINKGSWTVVSSGQHAKTTCLTICPRRFGSSDNITCLLWPTLVLGPITYLSLLIFVCHRALWRPRAWPMAQYPYPSLLSPQ